MDATDEFANSTDRRSLWRWGVLVVVMSALVLLYLVATTRRQGTQGTQGPAIGRTLPYLRLEPLTGKAAPVSLDDLKGRVTLVNYWGTWCPPCRLEFPHIANLASSYGTRDDFRLYAVSCGSGPDEDEDTLRSETKAFLDAAKVDLPTWWDQNSASRRALATVLDGGGFGYPTTIVLDRQGVIRGQWVGYSRGTEREMESIVGDLLKQ